MTRLRKLIPQSPWCATVTAWCALVSIVANVTLLVSRVGVAVWHRIEVWRILHGLHPLVALDPTAGQLEPTVTFTFSLFPSSNILFALMLFGVAHVLRILVPLCVPDSNRTKPCGGVVALATALGAVLVFVTGYLCAAIIVGFAASFQDGGPVFAPGLAWGQMAFLSLVAIVGVLGLAMLPFCLLRIVGRRFVAPPADSPEDADVHRAEALLSTALVGGGAALVGDVTWRVLPWLTHSYSAFLVYDVAIFAFLLVLPILWLRVLAAMRDALRRLLADGTLPDEPGERKDLFAAVVLLVVLFVFILPESCTDVKGPYMVIFGLVILAVFGAHLALCAKLVDRLPVPPGRQPAPPLSPFAEFVRARIGLALGIAALGCATVADLGVAAPLLAASAALCYGVRRACPHTAKAGLAAAALALVFLLAFTLRYTGRFRESHSFEPTAVPRILGDEKGSAPVRIDRDGTVFILRDDDADSPAKVQYDELVRWLETGAFCERFQLPGIEVDPETPIRALARVKEAFSVVGITPVPFRVLGKPFVQWDNSMYAPEIEPSLGDLNITFSGILFFGVEAVEHDSNPFPFSDAVPFPDGRHEHHVDAAGAAEAWLSACKSGAATPEVVVFCDSDAPCRRLHELLFALQNAGASVGVTIWSGNAFSSAHAEGAE